MLDVQKGKFVSLVSNVNCENENKLPALYVKEKFAISDRAYQEISLLTHDLPRKNDLKKLSDTFDHESTIDACPNGITGVQQNLQDRLHIRLQNIIKTTS